MSSTGARDWVAELRGGSVLCVDTSKTYTCWEVYAPALITMLQQLVPSCTQALRWDHKLYVIWSLDKVQLFVTLFKNAAFCLSGI